MKKLTALILTALMALALITGCGGGSAPSQGGEEGETEEFSVDSAETVGEILSLESEVSTSYCFDDTYFVYGFEYGGDTYRIVARLPEDQAEEISTIDITQEGGEEALFEKVSPLPIDRIDNLSAGIPTDESMAEWIGKTGGDLLDAGWYTSGWNLDEEVFWLNYGPYAFDVTFNEPVENPDDFDEYEAFPHMTVKSITCTGVGDASYRDDLYEE